MRQLEQFGHRCENSEEGDFGAGVGVSGETAQNWHDAAELLGRMAGPWWRHCEGKWFWELFGRSCLHGFARK